MSLYSNKEAKIIDCVEAKKYACLMCKNFKAMSTAFSCKQTHIHVTLSLNNGVYKLWAKDFTNVSLAKLL